MSRFGAILVGLGLFTQLAAAQPDELVLVPGKFGNALDARQTPVVIDGHERYRTLPLTIECWVKLADSVKRNALIACDPQSHPKHWGLYTAAQTGQFEFALGGFEPRLVTTDRAICDNRWHYLAASTDGQTVKLYVDGQLVREALLTQVKPPKPGKEPKGGTLTIGLATDGPAETRCVGLIDDVRITRGVLKIAQSPTAPLPLELATQGIWRFDEASIPGIDPAWTPRPLTGNAAAWEKETDKDWIDPRLRQMDTGPTFNATILHSHGPAKIRAYKATAIRLPEGGVVFDRGQLRWSAAWSGSFLTHSDKRFGLLNTPMPAGEVFYSTGNSPGVEVAAIPCDLAHPATAPLPDQLGRFTALRHVREGVVVEYAVGRSQARVRELARVSKSADGWTFTRAIRVAASEVEIRLLLAEGECELVGSCETGRLVTQAQRQMLVLPASKLARLFEVSYTRRPAAKPLLTLVPRERIAGLNDEPPPLNRWRILTSSLHIGPEVGPLALDTLVPPFQNPYNALFFLSGVDVYDERTLAVCTAHGDVWLVRGMSDKPGSLSWTRFATGLAQPLGLKVVGGKIYVIERGQLTQLTDSAGRGEADVYACVSNDWHTGAGEHSFDTCLEVDPQGYFFFHKTGDTETPTGGCLMRISPQGKAEVYATGFRHPIGLGMSPKGVVSGADQEGNWMPATRLDLYKRGGFYGDMRAHHRPTPPLIYDPPLLWLPREADNSAGGQVWIPDGAWGPFGGRMLHLSYGRCKAYLVSDQDSGSFRTGAAMDLGLFFQSGAARAAFHPREQALYVVGLRGWQTAARADGCLQRVRYTGKPVTLPLTVRAVPEGVRLTFASPLHADSADPARWTVEQWGYRWSADYGSKRWSVDDPNKPGPDSVPVKGVEVSPDGRVVLLRLPQVKPVMQMQIGYNLKLAGGEPLLGNVYATISASVRD